MPYGDNNYNLKYLQSEVWFSDIDENPDVLMDEIVLNEDICNDLNCDSEEIITLCLNVWICYEDDTYNIKYLQSEVWFSDIDENPKDLIDDIVLNEDIVNDLNCGSRGTMTSEQVSLFYISLNTFWWSTLSKVLVGLTIYFTPISYKRDSMYCII